MTTNEARTQLKKHFPTETVEDYDDHVVIVSKHFIDRTEEDRKNFVQRLIPGYAEGLILRTPAEVKNQVLHPAVMGL